MKQQTKRQISSIISVVTSALLFTSIPAFPQTVADAARQERERKKAAVRALHVYTNEDLAKPQILVPDDQARVAHKKVDTPGVEATIAPRALPTSPQPAAPITAAVASASVSPTPASRPLNSTSRKDAAARTIASTPNIRIIDSFTGPTVIASPAAPKSLAFPVTASDATPLFTPRGQVPIPVVNLPQPTANAYPLASVTSVVNFPQPPTASPRSTAQTQGVVVAPTVDTSYATVFTTHIALPSSSISTTVLAQPQIATHPSKPAQKERVIARPEAPVMPAPVSPLQPFVETAPLNAMVPASASKPALSERVNLPSEPPVMPVLTAPVQPSIEPVIAEPMIADAPLSVPIAPAPVEKPAQLPARTPEEFAGAMIIVQRGDSLWKLAKRYLGNAERWTELAKGNPQLGNPNLIRPGDPIHLPRPVQPRAEVKKIIIRRGDTLWSVAQAEFAQPLAFACIAHANPQLRSADVIRAGETLVLPEACEVSR